MSRFTIERKETKEETLHELNLLRKAINSDDEHFCSYSLLLFFKDRKPLRIRELNTNQITSERTDPWFNLWAEEGTGTLNIRISRHDTLRELWPERRTSSDGSPEFFYFEGFYGGETLWAAVRGARSVQTPTIGAITNWFMNGRTAREIFDDIVVNRGGDPDYRSFRFSIWKDGILTARISRLGGDEDVSIECPANNGSAGWAIGE